MGRGFGDDETELNDDPSAPRFVVQRPQLVWRDGTGDHHVTIERTSSIGSARDAAVVIEDKTVSRLHAELEPRADGLWIRDLGSRNGTFVEGLLVGSARVPQGATIRVGNTSITVRALVERNVELWPHASFGPLVGASVVMREMFARLALVAASDATALVTGETGTGKELVARAIHEASPRAGGPLVIVDCGALPEHLLESELFGHARGAFTGAMAAREGAFEAAEGGTLFLDEIGELPLSMQPKLLRALEARTIRRVGETNHRRVDVRFLSATNKNLATLVNSGAFREDLYFRLAVLLVNVPPLRERMEDIPAIVAHLYPRQPADWQQQVVREALTRAWTGNVRELRNFLDRAAALGLKEATDFGAAPATSSGADLPSAFHRPYREFCDDMEREYLKRLLARHGGNATAAAHAAGLNRTYIHRLIKKHDR
jgi:transcriptional regulator with GAF, ATPase, and Fis domain